MINMRFASFSDKADFRKIWDKCFNDSKVFSDWLFDARFVPEMSVCLEFDGKIVCCIQSLPIHIYMRGKTVPSALVLGVSTDPEFRGRGFMKQLFSFYLNNIAEKGVVLAPLTPEKLTTYYFAGAYPVCDVRFMEGLTDKSIKSNGTFLADKKEYMSAIYGLYNGFMKNYSGMVSRSFADFCLKADDYTVDGGLLAVHKTDGKTDGYSFFYDMDDIVYAEETVWENEAALRELISFIASFAENKKYKIKLPADGKGVPRSVLAIPSVEGILRILNIKSDGIIEVIDTVTRANNGCFSLCGKKTDKPPHISMEIGAFAQLISGYLSLSELINQGRVTVYDKNMAEEIDFALPKQNTFIFDDY